MKQSKAVVSSATPPTFVTSSETRLPLNTAFAAPRTLDAA